MERKDKEELVNLTSNILVNLENQLPSAPDDHISFKFISREGYSFSLKGDTLTNYDKSIDLISRDKNLEDISMKTIENEYLNLLIYFINIENPTRAQIKLQLEKCLNRLKNLIKEFRVIAAIER